MSELIEDIQEDIKREDLINFWKKYGKFIISAVVVFVLAVSGVLYWQHYKQEQKAKISLRFQEIISSLEPGSPEKTIKDLQEFSLNASSGYKILSQFSAAGLMPDIAQAFSDISNDKSIEKSFREIASLLSAISNLDGANPRVVLEMLASFESSGSPFRPLAREIVGYALMRLGNIDTAKSMFESLIRDQMASIGIRTRAESMLQYIRGLGK
jgi:hypothetical protein